ncbi:hypothetical protein [Halorussus aquaticus]|uniref:Peptidase n=1 Tax=Halorussus aquaticus TaxID=2953748 RepID=A0ABD5Q0K7_9EURY|nr:hypothetical protein [Halorussus aquaticus]
MVIAAYLLASIAACALGYAVGRIGTRALTAGDGTEVASRLRRLVAVWGGTVTVAAVGTAVVTGAPDAVRTALAPTLPDTLGTALGWSLVLPAAVLATVSAYYAVFPAMKGTGETDTDRTTATLAAARTLGVHALILGVPVALAATVADAQFGLGVVGIAVAALPVGSYLAGPTLVALSVSARAPTDDEQRRLAEATEATPLSDVPWRVVEGAFGSDAEMAVVGPVGFRRLYVSERFFERSEAAFESMLAIHGERERLSYRGVAALVLSLKVSVGVALLGLLLKLAPVRPTPGTVAVALPAGVVTVVVLDLLCWRLGYRADRRAASRVGAERLSDSLRELAAQAGVEENPSRIVQHLRSRPSLARRLSNVRDER